MERTLTKTWAGCGACKEQRRSVPHLATVAAALNLRPGGPAARAAEEAGEAWTRGEGCLTCDWPLAEKLVASTPSPVGRNPEGCTLQTLSPLHPTLLTLLLEPSTGSSKEVREARLMQPTRVRTGQDGEGGPVPSRGGSSSIWCTLPLPSALRHTRGPLCLKALLLPDSPSL